MRLLARIKPGVSRLQAQAEMRVLLQSLVEQKAARNHTKVKPIQLDVEPAGAGFARVREQYGKALMLLLGVVGLLLLLACINMASLLLARSAGRQRELAVRVGLCAGRGRLVRQMLTEAVILSAAGTLVGMLLAYAGTATSSKAKRVMPVSPFHEILHPASGTGLPSCVRPSRVSIFRFRKRYTSS